MKKTSALNKSLISFYWRDKKAVAILVLVTLLAAFTKTYMIVGDFFLLRSIAEQEPFERVVFLLSILLSASILNFIFYSLQNFVVDLQITKSTYFLEMALAQKLINLDYKSFNQEAKKTYLNLILNNITQINANIKEQLNFPYAIAFTISSIAFMVFINYYMLIIIFASALLGIIVYVPTYYYSNSKEIVVSKHQERYLRGLNNALETFQAFLLTNKIAFFLQRFNRLTKKNFWNISITRQKAHTVGFLYNLVDFGSIVAGLLTTLYLWSIQLIPTTLLLTSLNKLVNIKNNIFNVFNVFRTLNQINYFQRHWNKLFEEKFESSPHPAKEFKTLELKNILLKFKDENNQEKVVLKDFNLKLKRGQKLLIVGKNGSGKSSIINLIMNRLTPQKGEVLINNIAYQRETSIEHLVSLCTNRVLLEEDTLDNIIISHKDENPNREKIEYLKKLFLINFLDHFKKDEIIDPKRISEGQAQRIALAQSFYPQREFVILDEALSNLDKEKREKIFKDLMKIEKTLIFISHHLDQEDRKVFDLVVDFDLLKKKAASQN